MINVDFYVVVSFSYVADFGQEELQLAMALSASLHPPHTTQMDSPPGKRSKRGKGRANERDILPSSMIMTSSAEAQKMMVQRASAILQEVYCQPLHVAQLTVFPLRVCPVDLVRLPVHHPYTQASWLKGWGRVDLQPRKAPLCGRWLAMLRKRGGASFLFRPWTYPLVLCLHNPHQQHMLTLH